MSGLFFIIYLILSQVFAAPSKITVGLSADYPPFEFKQGNKLAGFDVDLAKEIGKQLGATIEIKEMNFAMLFSALNHGEIDLIISSVTINEEKAQHYDFSTPYYHDTYAILHKGNTLSNIENLKEKKIACQMGTTGMQAWIKDHVSNANIILMDTMPQMAEALKANHIDAALMDTTQAKEFVKNSKNLTYTVVGSVTNGTGIVMKKGSRLKGDIDKAIEKLSKNDFLKVLEDKWIKNSSTNTNHSISKDFLFIAKGLPITLMYSFLAIFLGGILGIFFAVTRHLKPISSWIITSFISVIRGTPLLLQLSFMYFSVPALVGIKLDIITAGTLTLALNTSAYITEILRAGIQSLPKGQFDAAQALGISKWYAWKDIILPQVFRNVFPALLNEIVTLTKESALISVLGEMDIMRRAQALAAETYNYFEPMCFAGIIYYVLVKIIESIGKRIEKRWHHA